MKGIVREDKSSQGREARNSEVDCGVVPCTTFARARKETVDCLLAVQRVIPRQPALLASAFFFAVPAALAPIQNSGDKLDEG